MALSAHSRAGGALSAGGTPGPPDPRPTAPASSAKDQPSWPEPQPLPHSSHTHAHARTCWHEDVRATQPQPHACGDEGLNTLALPSQTHSGPARLQGGSCGVCGAGLSRCLLPKTWARAGAGEGAEPQRQSLLIREHTGCLTGLAAPRSTAKSWKLPRGLSPSWVSWDPSPGGLAESPFLSCYSLGQQTAPGQHRAPAQGGRSLGEGPQPHAASWPGGTVPWPKSSSPRAQTQMPSMGGR